MNMPAASRAVLNPPNTKCAGFFKIVWDVAGDLYLLKLYRDFVLHQTREDGTPNLDWGHLVESLNKLDAGLQEKASKSYQSLGALPCSLISMQTYCKPHCMCLAGKIANHGLCISILCDDCLDLLFFEALTSSSFAADHTHEQR